MGIDEACACYTAAFLSGTGATCASELAGIDTQNPGAMFTPKCPP
jgi:hypothetical protein